MSPPKAPPPLRRFLPAILGLCVILVVAIGLVLGRQAWQPAERPEVWTSGNSPPPAGTPPDTRATFGLTETEEQISFRSSSSSSRPAFVRARTIGIVVRSPDEMAERVARALAQRLHATGRYEKVTLHPFAEGDPRSPDLLEDATFEVSTRSLETHDGETEVILDLAGFNMLPSSGNTRISTWGTAFVEWHLSGTYTQRSRFRGLRFGKQLGPMAEKAAEGLQTKIEGHLEQLVEKHGPMPELPPEFYPPFQSPPTLAFLERLGARPEGVRHSLFLPTVARWRLKSIEPTEPLFAGIEAQLRAEGWQTSELETDPSEIPILRMTRGDEEQLEVFPDDPEASPLVPEDVEGATIYHVTYRKASSKREQQAALAEYLDSDAADPAVVAAFRDRLPRESAEQALQLLEQSDLGKPGALEAHYQFWKAVRPDRPWNRELLLRGFWRRCLRPEQTSLQSLAESLDEDLLPDGWPPQELLFSPEIFFAAGILPFPDELPLDQPYQLGERRAWYHPGQPSEICWIELRESPIEAGLLLESGRTTVRRNGDYGGGSRTSEGFSNPPTRAIRQILRLQGPDGYRTLEAQFEPPKAESGETTWSLKLRALP